MFQAQVRSTFDPSSVGPTTEISPKTNSLNPSQVRQLGVGKGAYEKRWKRKNLVRKTLKDTSDREKEIERSRRNLGDDTEDIRWNTPEEELEERIKRNYKEYIPAQGQDRAAVWGLQQAFLQQIQTNKIYL